MHEFKLSRIHHDAIPTALEKARQYRLLLEPEQAESICLDILAIEPDNHPANILLILSLTDQFTRVGQVLDAKRVLALIEKLPTRYDRLYYQGLVSERRGRAMLQKSMSCSFAYGYFHKAIFLYQSAQKEQTNNNDDAILRSNACLRTIQDKRLEPRADRDEIYDDGEG